MNWTQYFDKIILINLPHRKDRLSESIDELYKHNIPFELFPATYDKEDGARGLFNTMTDLFQKSVDNSWNNILVFEDDFHIVVPDLASHMDKCVEDLMGLNWDLFYMGGNVQSPLMPVKGHPSLFQCSNVLSTHAVGYSGAVQSLILEELKKGQRRVDHVGEPVDQLFERVVQSRGKSYISQHMLAVQRESFSDILGFEINYKNRVQDVFNQRLREANGL